jgi:methionyl-tRNA formyltransferase
VRVVFAGSPAIAVPALKALAAMELLGDAVFLAGVITNPDSARGRGKLFASTDISLAVDELNRERGARGLAPIPLLKPEKLRLEAREETAALRPDLLVSFACGHIFGPKFLALFPLGGINVHPSLLPKYRGPTPIPAAILNRDTETGITIQKLAAEIDAGDILIQERFPLSLKETAGELSKTAAEKAAEILPRAIRDIAMGKALWQPQTGAPSYCPLIAKEDGLINWEKSAAEIDAIVRAYNPWPLAWTKSGERNLYILEAEAMEEAEEAALRQEPGGAALPAGTVLGKQKGRGIVIAAGKGTLLVKRLQYQAKKALDWQAFLNGARGFLGSRLG